VHVDYNIIQKLISVLPYRNMINQSSKQVILPNSLTSLTFSKYCNQNIKNDTQTGNLTFYYKSDKSLIKFIVPNSLEFLTFGDTFNQPIDILPNSLKSLTFGNNFNQPIKKNILPNGLKFLTFGFYFNQPFTEGTLPNSLISLSFGVCFNQSLKNILPNNLESLMLGFYFDQPLENILPFMYNLTLLKIYRFDNKYNEYIRDKNLLSKFNFILESSGYYHTYDRCTSKCELIYTRSKENTIG